MDKNLGAFRLNPAGDFDPNHQYEFFDLVTYNGSSFVCINEDIIDGVSNIGILPEGEEKSPLYYQLVAHKGDQGDIAPHYDSFITLDSRVWDYSLSDKVIIPEDMEFDEEHNVRLSIENVYDGCCGLIMSYNKNIVLPTNSDYSADFDYIELENSVNNNIGQYYMYSFVCRQIGEHQFTLMWHRSVMNNVRF